jgi:hypothetical protein
VKFEVVTLVSSTAEMAMLRKNFLERTMGFPLTVLVRPGVPLPSWDLESIHTVPMATDGFTEKAIKEYAGRARSPWLLQIDPDERWPNEAFQRAEELTSKLDESEAASFPMTYFVGSRPLRGGPWSGNYYQRLNSAVSHLQSVEQVHTAPPASRVEKVRLTTAVQHFWVRDLGELRAKTDLYLASEGKARMTRFGPYRLRKAAVQMVRTTGGCLRSAPWKDGFLGIRLAAEMVRYQWKANAAWRQEHQAVYLSTRRHRLMDRGSAGP